MRWPWNRSEVRESAPYSDAVIASIVSSAGGPSLSAVSATGALEAASSLIARSFASARVRSASAQVRAVLSPSLLGAVGRSMVRSGEAVYVIDTTGGRLGLLPASSWDIQGAPNEAAWTYRATVPGPTQTQTVTVASQGVVHVRLQVDQSRPWRGVAPLQAASLAGRLSSCTISALADEAGMAVGGLLPVPTDGQDKSVEQLRLDIRNLRGSLSLVESGDWGDVGAGRPRGDWRPIRLGADPPEALIQLAEFSSREVLSCLGIPVGLMDGSTPGAAQREAFRRFAFSTLLGMSRVVEAELTAKLETPIRLDFGGLMAADVVGKARAAGSLVKAGVEVERALSLVGLAED